jgi:hypothetical protein
MVRAPEHTIPAPPFPHDLPWVNVAPLRMDKQRGRPVLVEFWDFCRVNSLRTLPYVRAWHERYEADGLRVIGVHTGAYPPSRDEQQVRAAVARLELPYPVVIDTDLLLWDLYGNEGWPARYLWDQRGALFSLHYGEGAYGETEPYEAGAVWAVVSGPGELVVNGRAVAVADAGCVELIDHGRHEEGVLELEPTPGIEVYATCFTPGVVPD